MGSSTAEEALGRLPLPGGLDTPCLIIELPRLHTNIELMASRLEERGVALRPHFKTHKSIEIARLQRTAGSRGFTAATIGEAEVLAAAGFDDILIAYPVWMNTLRAERIERLRDVARITIGVESEGGARAGGELHAGLSVLVEVDPGADRTGVQPAGAGRIAEAATDAGLAVQGVFCHGGHSYRAPGAAADAAEDEVKALAEAVTSVRESGYEPRIVSAGSTPTACLSARSCVTEERPGTYVFNDRQMIRMGVCNPEDAALVVAATVVSASPGKVVLDSGAKALSSDRLPWMSGFGEIVGYPDCEITRLYDHHAVVETGERIQLPELGEVVGVIPNHVCPVVNLFDEFVVSEHGTAVDRWRVDGRGRNT